MTAGQWVIEITLPEDELSGMGQLEVNGVAEKLASNTGRIRRI